MSDHVSAEYKEPTNLRVLESLIGVLANRTAHDIPNRYGTAIFLIAAFIESTANLLWDFLIGAEKLEPFELGHGLSGQDSAGNYLSKPIRKLLAIYKKECRADCPHNIEGLQDIFDVRNKIAAHPAGASREALDLRPDGSWERQRLDRKVAFRKFTDWPTVLSRFNERDAVCAISETRTVFTALNQDLTATGVDSSLLARAFPSICDIAHASEDTPTGGQE